MLQPATKTSSEVGINLKGTEPQGKLDEVKSANAMCSHKVNVADISEVDKELVAWLKAVYEGAG